MPNATTMILLTFKTKPPPPPMRRDRRQIKKVITHNMNMSQIASVAIAAVLTSLRIHNSAQQAAAKMRDKTSIIRGDKVGQINMSNDTTGLR